MNFKILLSVFIMVSFLSCDNSKVAKQKYAIELLSVEEMDSLLQLEKVQLIDVRTPEEFAKGHIEGAFNLDYRSPNFKKLLSQIDKSKPVAIYCQKGGRSNACSEDMEKAGFTEIYDLKGGITQWIYKGEEIVK